MIYSQDHKFLYLKNRKVGGSSTEIFLSQIMPENAIVTPVHPEVNGHRPRNFDGFYNHMPYSEINDKIDLSDVYSCITVRDPFESVLSDLFLQLVYSERIDELYSDKKKTVEEYFSNGFVKPWLKSTKYIYTIDNQICVSDIMRYEKGIEPEINRVLKQYDLSMKILINQKKHRPDGVTYLDIFTKSQIDQIEDEWSWEIDEFGYKRLD